MMVNGDRDKDAKTIQWSFQQRSLKGMKVELPPQTIYRVNSKRIKDLPVRAKTIKSLDAHIGVNLLDLGFGNDI